MPGAVVVVGLGPAGLDRVTDEVRELLTDAANRVILRTRHHPAADELSAVRPVESGDDLYDQAEGFDQVYRRLAERVLDAARSGDVVYAVPGSPSVGERSVSEVRQLGLERGVAVQVLAGESFLDLVLARAGIDPLARGLQVLDGRDLPYPLLLSAPTVIAQVDRARVAADVKDALGRLLDSEVEVTVLSDIGTSAEHVETMPLSHLDRAEVGPRTTVVVDPPPAGWPGLVQTIARLRQDCPWDARQTHHSLVRHLIEETYEVVEAIGRFPADAPAGPVEAGVYAELEDELGDLLLQVVFHATFARESTMFDVEDVAEQQRRKLVRRHPHVFGVDGGEPTSVEGAHEVVANWERIKQDEKQRESLMDDVPASMPALARAAKVQRRAASVGFDWEDAAPVVEKVAEEVEELTKDIDDPRRASEELGDLLFSVVNLGRHLHIDPEMALRQAVDRFAERFRAMERLGDLEGLPLEELDRRWQQVKTGTERDP